MPQEPLPPECFLEILHFFVNKYPYDTDTMAHLLRVSKTFCATTLPFLYGDCLNACIRKDAMTTTIQMIRTLLRQVHPQNRIPVLLRVAYLSQEDQDNPVSMEEQSPPPVFKYGRFIRRIVPQWYSPSVGTFNFVHIDSLVMEYATTHQLFDQYVAEGVLSNNIHDDVKDKAFEDALKMDIHRQLIWILCQDHMDTIEELAIPLFDIERYIDHADQFTSLSKVTFSFQNDTNPWGYRQATHENGFDPAQNVASEKHDRYSRGMLQFVQKHTSIHKNVLQDFDVEAGMYPTSDLYFEIQALLPPLHTPRSIDRWNWIKFVARVKDTNLNHLESIGMYTRNELDDSTGWLRDKAYELLRSQPFLPRCRALKELKMNTLGPDMFQWAVQEKKQMDGARQQERISSLQVSTRQHGHHSNVLVPLVPLRSVTLDTKELRPPVQELDDIAFAFSDTLEEITMRVGWSKDRVEYDSLASTPQVAYGQGWDLPHLRTLVLSVNQFQLYFDMNGLGRCRALESIRLRDEIMPYNHREVRSWSPVSLPHLKVLDLQGSPALRFNMDSLHHSPYLETLSLSMEAMYYSDRCYYIPSAEELERDDSDNQGTDSHEISGMPGPNQEEPGSIGRRPRYTWDWYLPNLSDLQLAAVFAFQFDFQWLQYLPNLQRLRLDMRSSRQYDPTVSHKRRITLKDITRGQHLHQQDEDGFEEILSDQFISLPKLDTMYLFGQWNFKKKVVETFCSSVAPNLRYAEFGNGYAGITPQESIALVKRMPCLQYIYLGLPLTPEKMQGLGLAHWGEVPEQEKHCNKQLVFDLHGYGCHSFVVR
ncbi:MAG: hypothetical protein J3Q66DRAFT_333442 [Benniella sp.]|nr:MAG: hypothetical protein J3Q66DRAFT_333442 [Benniella sp.]